MTAVLRDTLSAVAGFPLSDVQWAQATLASRLGGLGILDPSEQRVAARLSAISDFASRGHRALSFPSHVPVVPPDFPICLARATATLGSIAPLPAWSLDASSLPVADRCYSQQRWWSEQIFLAKQKSLTAAMDGGNAVRFASQSQPHAMSWTAVVPSAPLRTLLPDEDFRNLLRWHLGHSVLPDHSTHTCPQCSAVLDKPGHHLVCCIKNGLQRRHGAVQDFLYRLAVRAGFTARKEQTGLDRTRPGDVFVHRFTQGQPAAVDLTIRHTLAPSHPTPRTFDLSAWQRRQEESKVSLYGAQCDRLGWQFMPCILDCYGGIGDDGRTFLAACVRLLLGQRSHIFARATEANVWQGLTLTVAKEVSRQLRGGTWAAAVAEDGGRGAAEGSLPARWAHSPYAASVADR